MDQDEVRLSGDLSSIQGNLGGPGLKMDFSVVRRYRSLDAILSATPSLGCDMPFIRKETITYMAEQARTEDIIVPWTEAGYEPLHALYNRSCLPHMLRAIDFDRMKVSDLFRLLSVKVIKDASLFVNKGVSTFTNINTEEDLAVAERLIG
jgi:molybdopterin-guanine dinucleotide biosynthesis protein A